jgi:hypothetical protein
MIVRTTAAAKKINRLGEQTARAFLDVTRGRTMPPPSQLEVFLFWIAGTVGAMAQLSDE